MNLTGVPLAASFSFQAAIAHKPQHPFPSIRFTMLTFDYETIVNRDNIDAIDTF